MDDSQKKETSWETGEKGESDVSKLLEKLGAEYRVIDSIYLEIEDDETPLRASIQIDHVVLSVYGIFVIETKNWSQENFEWPVNQNKKHVDAVAGILSVDDDDIFSMVVLAGEANLPKDTREEVIYKKNLIKDITYKTRIKLFTEEEVSFFYDEIQKNNLRLTREQTYQKDHDKYVKFLNNKGAGKTKQTTDDRITEAKISQTKSRVKTVIFVAVLLGLMWAAFVYLIPRLNISSIVPIQLENIWPTQSDQSITNNTGTDVFRTQFMEQLAQYESEVEPKIDEIRLNEWAAEKYAELQDLKARAIELFANGEYLLAREKLQQAGVLVAQASAEYAERLAAAMRDAQEAFDDDRAPEAEKAVREALRLNPLDAEMLALEKRIAVMPRVLDLLRRAAVAQNENRPEKEATALREALSLDPSRKAAESRLKTLRTQLKQQRFAGAVRGAQRALDTGDLAAAEQHIALAKNISPASAELGVLQKRLAQARTERAFAAQLSLGEQAKARDDWPVAEKHFERARQLKPDDKTAVENHDLAARVVGATEKIRRTLDREHRLGDQSVLDSVAAYLREVEALAGVSPGLQKLHDELARKVDAYQTEVDVVVVSDNKTHIIVRGVGQVGKTARRTIRLRPGRRVFEGSRSGYQSKLVTVDLVPGAPAVEVSVVCDEKI